MRVVVASPDGSRAGARGLAEWLQTFAPSKAKGEVTVALVSDERMRALNRAFRGKDYATDVLSFPALDTRQSTVHRRRSSVDSRPPIARGPLSTMMSENVRSLGDIVIANGVARRQAAEARHSLGTELRVLALHGLLHLIGYDHERDEGQMTRVETRLRRAAGLKEGLIERGRKQQ